MAVVGGSVVVISAAFFAPVLFHCYIIVAMAVSAGVAVAVAVAGAGAAISLYFDCCCLPELQQAFL